MGCVLYSCDRIRSTMLLKELMDQNTVPERLSFFDAVHLLTNISLQCVHCRYTCFTTAEYSNHILSL
jgi:hypothetical protein